MSAAFWTAERVNTLRTLWQAGKSTPEIMSAIGAKTRGIVIGKAHRLGLFKDAKASPPKPAPKTPRPVLVRPPPLPPPVIVQPPPSADAPAPGMRSLRILDEGFSGCRWCVQDPLDGEDARFCCAPTQGKTFCPTHRAIAHPPPTVRKGGQELIRGLRRYIS